jgi:hypothetical protein
MDKKAVIARIEEIGKAIENSMAQHNALVGRLNEAQYILQEMEKFEQDCKARDYANAAEDIIEVAEEVVSEKKTSGEDS